METPYRAVAFEETDTITREYVEQISNNLQWLNDSTPRSRIIIDHGDNTREIMEERMVVLCGKLPVGKSKKHTTVKRRVWFGDVFAPTSRPNITTGIVAQGVGNVFVVMNGLQDARYPTAKGAEFLITAAGAEGKVAHKKGTWEIAKPIFVHWQAFGFRVADEYGL